MSAAQLKAQSVFIWDLMRFDHLDFRETLWYVTPAAVLLLLGFSLELPLEIIACAAITLIQLPFFLALGWGVRMHDELRRLAMPYGYASYYESAVHRVELVTPQALICLTLIGAAALAGLPLLAQESATLANYLRISAILLCLLRLCLRAGAGLDRFSSSQIASAASINRAQSAYFVAYLALLAALAIQYVQAHFAYALAVSALMLAAFYAERKPHRLSFNILERIRWAMDRLPYQSALNACLNMRAVLNSATGAAVMFALILLAVLNSKLSNTAIIIALIQGISIVDRALWGVSQRWLQRAWDEKLLRTLPMRITVRQLIKTIWLYSVFAHLFSYAILFLPLLFMRDALANLSPSHSLGLAALPYLVIVNIAVSLFLNTQLVLTELSNPPRFANPLDDGKRKSGFPLVALVQIPAISLANTFPENSGYALGYATTLFCLACIGIIYQYRCWQRDLPALLQHQNRGKYLISVVRSKTPGD
jgi:hypothetical protein